MGQLSCLCLVLWLAPAPSFIFPHPVKQSWQVWSFVPGSLSQTEVPMLCLLTSTKQSSGLPCITGQEGPCHFPFTMRILGFCQELLSHSQSEVNQMGEKGPCYFRMLITCLSFVLSVTTITTKARQHCFIAFFMV